MRKDHPCCWSLWNVAFAPCWKLLQILSVTQQQCRQQRRLFLFVFLFFSVLPEECHTALAATAGTTTSTSTSMMAAAATLNSNHNRPFVYFDCLPCIDRSESVVRVLIHGSKDNAFWEPVAAAIRQIATSMRVTLQFELYDEFQAQFRMADDIRQAVREYRQSTKQQQEPPQQPPLQQQANNNNNTTTNDNLLVLENSNTTSTSTSSSEQLVSTAVPSSGSQQQPPQQRFRGRPAVLLVSIPTPEVAEAVREAVEAGLPVFGMNSGYHQAAALGVAAFVGMDEYKAGLVSAREFFLSSSSGKSTKKLHRALFVQTAVGNHALEQRLQGFRDGLARQQQQQLLQQQLDESTTNSTNSTTTTPNIIVDVLLLEGGPSEPEAPSKFQKALRGCPYQAIMASATTVDLALDAIRNACDDNDNTTTTTTTTTTTSPQFSRRRRPLLGSFDTTTRVYRGLAVGELDFAVSQQAWLQAAMATAMASLYASTGMRLQYASQVEFFGSYLSGPQIVTIDQRLPTDTTQICETQGFPVCQQQKQSQQQQSEFFTLDTTTTTTNPNAAVVGRAGDNNVGVAVPRLRGNSSIDSDNTDVCPCFDRPRFRLAAVVHGIQTDSFWWRVRDGARQASRDLQIDLVDFVLFPPNDNNNPDVLHRKMASRILSLCQDAHLGGLIVSIPSPAVVPALERCSREFNVPLVSINAGGEISRQLGFVLHHVAQDEYLAGYLGGQELIAQGATRGICLNHVPQLDVVVQRCAGFADAFRDAFGDNNNTTTTTSKTTTTTTTTTSYYLGAVGVVEDNDDITIARTESAVAAAGGDWNNLGILAGGLVVARPVLALLETHPEALGGTFDNDPVVSAALQAGKLVFGIDQQSYLQGYVPVLLLTWFAQTQQSLVNRYISSGPSLIRSVPSPAEAQCQENSFAVCPPPIDMEKHQLGAIRLIGDFMAGIVLLTAFCLMAFVLVKRHSNQMRQAQPFFLCIVCLGAAFMGFTIWALGVDDGIASTNACNVACMLAPWLFTIGFTITFAALYGKIRRLNKLIRHAEHFRRVTVKVRDVMKPFLALLGLNLVLLTTWTAVDPMFWKRTFVSETESYGLCRLGQTGVSMGLAWAIFFVNVMALILALVEAWKSRRVSYELTDSGSVAIVVASILQVAIVGVPTLPLVREDPQASFLLKSGLVFVISMSTLLFIFVPKLRNQSTASLSSTTLRKSVMMRNNNHYNNNNYPVVPLRDSSWGGNSFFGFDSSHLQQQQQQHVGTSWYAGMDSSSHSHASFRNQPSGTDHHHHETTVGHFTTTPHYQYGEHHHPNPKLPPPHPRHHNNNNQSVDTVVEAHLNLSRVSEEIGTETHGPIPSQMDDSFAEEIIIEEESDEVDSSPTDEATRTTQSSTTESKSLQDHETAPTTTGRNAEQQEEGQTPNTNLTLLMQMADQISDTILLQQLGARLKRGGIVRSDVFEVLGEPDRDNVPAESSEYETLVAI